jgi:hypothetical protein
MMSNQTLLPNPYLLIIFWSILNHLHDVRCTNCKIHNTSFNSNGNQALFKDFKFFESLNTNMFTLTRLTQEGANINGVVNSPFPMLNTHVLSRLSNAWINFLIFQNFYPKNLDCPSFFPMGYVNPPPPFFG